MANNKSEAAWCNVSRLSWPWSTHRHSLGLQASKLCCILGKGVMGQTHSSFSALTVPAPSTSHLLLLSSAVSFPTFQCGHLSSSTYTRFLFLAASPLKPRYTNLLRVGETCSLGGVRCVCCHINDIIKLQAVTRVIGTGTQFNDSRDEETPSTESDLNALR